MTKQTETTKEPWELWQVTTQSWNRIRKDFGEGAMKPDTTILSPFDAFIAGAVIGAFAAIISIAAVLG